MSESVITFVGGTVCDHKKYPDVKVKDLVSGPKISRRRPDQFDIGGGGVNAAIVAGRLAKIFNLQIQVNLVTKIGDGQDHGAKGLVRDSGVNLYDMLAGVDIGLPTNEIFSADERFILLSDIEQPEVSLDMPAIRAIERSTLVHTHASTGDISLGAARVASANSPKRSIFVDASSVVDNPVLDELLGIVNGAVLANDDIDAQSLMGRLDAHSNLSHMAVMCGADDTHFRVRDVVSDTVPVLTSSSFEVVCKSGAGDAARGAMLLAMAAGENFEYALRFGNAVSTFSCTTLGRDWLDALEGNPDLLNEKCDYDVVGFRRRMELRSNQYEVAFG